MIRSIGNDLTTIAARASIVPTSATPFADLFGSLGASGSAAPGSSFTTRHAAADDSGRATEEAAESAKLNEAVAAFKKELSLTPAERVRRDVLKSMDLTEQAIEALPPKQRVETEEKIAREVARRMEIMHGRTGRTAPAAGSTLP